MMTPEPVEFCDDSQKRLLSMALILTTTGATASAAFVKSLGEEDMNGRCTVALFAVCPPKLLDVKVGAAFGRYITVFGSSTSLYKNIASTALTKEQTTTNPYFRIH